MRPFRFPLMVSLLLGGLGVLGFMLAPRAPRADEVVEAATEDPDAEPLAPHVAGLWTRFPESRGDGDPVRFYFFHEKGFGLYRFGKIGLNTTQSFDWRVQGDQLVLTFRKSGTVPRTPFAVQRNAGAARLLLKEDPMEPLLHEVAYSFVPAPDANEALSDVFDAAGIGGRMWIDLQRFATGGAAFSMYQLRAAAIDGRGVGWHHVGDFDDWSTEALSYRDAGSELELWFNVRGDRARTRLLRAGDTVTLVEDPRSFWHVRRYKDGGPSFGALLMTLR